MAAQDWITQDLYAVLGVPDDSSDEALKRAYRRLVRQYHPDVNGGCPQAEHRFKEVGTAYAVLSDRLHRARYDHTRTSYRRHAWQETRRTPRGTRAGARAEAWAARADAGEGRFGSWDGYPFDHAPEAAEPSGFDHAPAAEQAPEAEPTTPPRDTHDTGTPHEQRASRSDSPSASQSDPDRARQPEATTSTSSARPADDAAAAGWLAAWYAPLPWAMAIAESFWTASLRPVPTAAPQADDRAGTDRTGH